MKEKQNSLYDLLIRKCTFLEYNSCANENVDTIEREIIESFPNLKIRKNLNISQLNTMNYIEIRMFIKSLLDKGLTLQTFLDELFNMYKEGTISGFDYRYTIEAIGLYAPLAFINLANETGRYID